MRIIKEGNPTKAKRTTPIYVVCQNCGLEAELECGEIVTKCPCCGSLDFESTTSFVDFCHKKSPSERFPDEYYHFTSRDGGDAKALSNEEVSKMIDKTIKTYKEANCGYAFSSTGDTFVAVFQTDEDDVNTFLVTVGKDYYEYDFCNGE